MLCCSRLRRQRGLICSGSGQSENALLVKMPFVGGAPPQTFPPQLVEEAPLLRDLRGIWAHGAVGRQEAVPAISAGTVSWVRALMSNIPAFLSPGGCLLLPLAGDPHGPSWRRRLRRGSRRCCCPGTGEAGRAAGE